MRGRARRRTGGARAPRRRKIRVPAGIETGKLGQVPFEDGAFNLIVVDNQQGLLSSMRPEDRVATLREAFRLLAPRGRIVIIEQGPRGGLGALFGLGLPPRSIPITALPAAPSSHSRPRASALPAYWESVTGCPSSKASDSGDTCRATLNFPSNSRSMYGKGFAFSQAGILLNGTNTEELQWTCTQQTR